MRIIFGILAVETIWTIAPMARAYAGAWVQNKGGGFSAVGVQRDDSEFGGAWRSDAYLEYGASENWTITAKTETLWRDDESGDDRLAALAALRRSLLEKSGFVASAQFGVLFGESLEGPVCEGTGMDSRLLGGWSGKWNDKPVYLNLETGYQNRGGCGRWKTDIALGVDLSRDWRLEAKSYSQNGDGSRSIKGETMLSRRISEEGQYLGVGYRRELSGEFEESSWVVSLYAAF